MKIKRILRKEFFITLFFKQNRWHRHGVFMHTLKLIKEAIKIKRYDFIIPALLHDIGKPIIAFQDEKDKKTGEYSFTNHEEISYQIIKKWKFLSKKTKLLVRYHYLLRGYEKALQKNKLKKAKRYKRIIESLDKNLLEDLKEFQILDDLAKK